MSTETLTNDTINTDGMTNDELKALGVTIPTAKHATELNSFDVLVLGEIDEPNKVTTGLLQRPITRLCDETNKADMSLKLSLVNGAVGSVVFVRLPHNTKADIYQSRDGAPAVKLFEAIPLGRGMFYQLDALDVSRIEWGKPLSVSQLLTAGIGGLVEMNTLVWAELPEPMEIDWQSIYVTA